MKCVIPGLNVKVLARAVHALFRIGDELYVEPGPSRLSFRAVSTSKSAYASFTFHESFFSYYSNEQVENRVVNDKYKVSMKSCLAVFRSPTHLDKQVESCQIRFEPDDVKLIFEFHCHHGIVKTHYLPIIECETLEAVYSKEMVPNRIVMQPKIFSFALMNFQLSTMELTLVVTPQKMQLRNYAENENEIKKSVRTELCLEPGEFDHYSIGVDTSITFCLREFRALLAFAESVNLPIAANFETGGRPVVFVVKNVPTFESNFVFATLMQPGSNQLNSSQQSIETINHSTSRQPKEKSEKNSIANISNKRRLSDIIENENHIDIQIPGTSKNFQGNNTEDITDNVSELLPKISINVERVDMSKQVSDKVQDNNSGEDEDTVPGTPSPPPLKKSRHIFKRCFQSTFNSQMIQGYDDVLADDSDEERT